MNQTLQTSKTTNNTPKQWKSFAEQLAILKSYGLLVDDDVKAISYLKRIGYYRLSGYWYPFRKMKLKADNFSYREDDFVDGSRFEYVVKLYVFDKKLRLLALDALERIESSIRVDIAYLLGEKDVFAHENPQLFLSNKKKDKTNHQRWLDKYKKLESRAKNKSFVKHNINKYEKLPIWVAIEILDFGALSFLYQCMTVKDKNEIAKKYELTNGNILQKWLISLNFIRNVSAHHSRLWNANIVNRSPVPDFDKRMRLDNSQAFLYFCIMQKMMRVICPKSTWGLRFKKLINEFPNIEIKENLIGLMDFGMPDNWKGWELWNCEINANNLK